VQSAVRIEAREEDEPRVQLHVPRDDGRTAQWRIMPNITPTMESPAQTTRTTRMLSATGRALPLQRHLVWLHPHRVRRTSTPTDRIPACAAAMQTQPSPDPRSATKQRCTTGHVSAADVIIGEERDA
jgi:hypothetical protein